MNIQIVAVGKLKEKYWAEGVAEYVKRLTPYTKLAITEVAEEKAPERLSEAEEQQVKHKEGERLLAALKPDAYVIAMSIDGQLWSSEELADQLDRLSTYGKSHVAFVIGGSLGLSDDVLRRADAKLSFGRITFPHQLIRVVLAEQIYRAFRIMRGGAYHK